LAANEGVDTETEALATLRERAQQALSRAHLATDPELRKQWTAIADAWVAILATLEQMDRRQSPAKKKR
jgi:uncharacterized membrane protein YccC